MSVGGGGEDGCERALRRRRRVSRSNGCARARATTTGIDSSTVLPQLRQRHVHRERGRRRGFRSSLGGGCRCGLCGWFRRSRAHGRSERVKGCVRESVCCAWGAFVCGRRCLFIAAVASGAFGGFEPSSSCSRSCSLSPAPQHTLSIPSRCILLRKQKPLRARVSGVPLLSFLLPPPPPPFPLLHDLARTRARTPIKRQAVPTRTRQLHAQWACAPNRGTSLFRTEGRTRVSLASSSAEERGARRRHPPSSPHATRRRWPHQQHQQPRRSPSRSRKRRRTVSFLVVTSWRWRARCAVVCRQRSQRNTRTPAP